MSIRKQLKSVLAKIETALDDENREKVKTDLRGILDMLKHVEKPDERVVTIEKVIEPPKPKDPDQAIINENIRLRNENKELRSDIDLILRYWIQDKKFFGDRLEVLFREADICRVVDTLEDGRRCWRTSSHYAKHQGFLHYWETEQRAVNQHAVLDFQSWKVIGEKFVSLYLRYTGVRLYPFDHIPD